MVQILRGIKQGKPLPFTEDLRYTDGRNSGGAVMAGRRICAGYYRRYDGKTVYVISTATDADTGEETVIWTALPILGSAQVFYHAQVWQCGNRETPPSHPPDGVVG